MNPKEDATKIYYVSYCLLMKFEDIILRRVESLIAQFSSVRVSYTTKYLKTSFLQEYSSWRRAILIVIVISSTSTGTVFSDNHQRLRTLLILPQMRLAQLGTINRDFFLSLVLNYLIWVMDVRRKEKMHKNCYLNCCVHCIFHK